MKSYDETRQQYKPSHIKVLLIAESPPPAADIQSSRQFYRADRLRTDDRLFTNTIRALYPEAINQSELELEQHKKAWLQRFQSEGWYMIEALEQSLQHEITKPQRQAQIRQHLPELIEHVRGLVKPNTEIILIKSNVFVVAAEPLRQAGFTILNKELVDYPGRFNQKAYRAKLSALAELAKHSS